MNVRPGRLLRAPTSTLILDILFKSVPCLSCNGAGFVSWGVRWAPAPCSCTPQHRKDKLEWRGKDPPCLLRVDTELTGIKRQNHFLLLPRQHLRQEGKHLNLITFSLALGWSLCEKNGNLKQGGGREISLWHFWLLPVTGRSCILLRTSPQLSLSATDFFFFS